jgi:long-chain acyl-CoA synthetase
VRHNRDEFRKPSALLRLLNWPLYKLEACLVFGRVRSFFGGELACCVGGEKALLISEDGEKYSPEEMEEAIVHASGLASQVMLCNDHRRFTSALVVLDEAAVARLVGRKRIHEPETLLKEISCSLATFETMPEHRGRFPGKWRPSTFLIFREPFSEKNKTINSTMKPVRFRIQETCRESLEYMYTKDGARAINQRNLAECAALLERTRNRRGF